MTMNKMTYTLTLAVLSLTLQPAEAATISGSFIGSTGSVGPDTQFSVTEDWEDVTSDTYVLSKSGAASGVFGSGAFAATVSGNTTTGEIKADLRVSRSGEPDVSPIPHISTWLSIAEEFLLTGTGTFSVYALVDAAWSFPDQGTFQFGLRTWPSGNHYAMGHDDFFVDTSGTPETVAGGQHDSFSKSGSVTDHLLMASVDIRDADNALQYFDFTFNASLTSWSGRAFLDAGHTATFMFKTTGDLVATPMTPGFLSQSPLLDSEPNPSPVPLPAGVPLLLSGLVALLGLGRLKRRAA
ncbi:MULTISPECIES: hypothetical protein [unclassified Haematobacter]|uniref:hypothetical protein n=1 Tax=unclassified Haematobacter TaxID=2640585 RepID=UPI0025C1BB0E|nr:MULTISPECIES: hypothetical protein [unclassified Haematobacter]